MQSVSGTAWGRCAVASDRKLFTRTKQSRSGEGTPRSPDDRAREDWVLRVVSVYPVASPSPANEAAVFGALHYGRANHQNDWFRVAERLQLFLEMRHATPGRHLTGCDPCRGVVWFQHASLHYSLQPFR